MDIIEDSWYYSLRTLVQVFAIRRSDKFNTGDYYGELNIIRYDGYAERIMGKE